jgi:transcriptional regulator with XRE-family HTH domain
MKLSRTSLGLAVRAARDAAKMTIGDLATATDISHTLLSRSENGLRDLSFTEVEAIAAAVKIGPEDLRTLAETFERAGAHEKQQNITQLQRDLNELQRKAVEAAIEVRALSA